MFLALRQGQTSTAQRYAATVDTLTVALFRESNPAPLKCALNLMGLMTAKVRLPLVEVSDATAADVAAAVVRVCEHHSNHIIGKVDLSRQAVRRVAR
jgi:4-hydroxy-tetrahydrodipicolinate synthase